MIERYTETQALRLNQLLRLDKQVYTANHHRDGEFTVTTSEGDLTILVNNHLRYAFWRMRRGRLRSLRQEGLGEIGYALLQMDRTTV